MTKRTLDESIIEILKDCKTAKTLHFIKDKYNFSHKKLCMVMSLLEDHHYLVVCVDTRDGRGTKQIMTTDWGRELLKALGVTI
jgi:hypothetical protein